MGGRRNSLAHIDKQAGHAATTHTEIVETACVSAGCREMKHTWSRQHMPHPMLDPSCWESKTSGPIAAVASFLGPIAAAAASAQIAYCGATAVYF